MTGSIDADGPAVGEPTADDEDQRNIAVLVQTLRNRAERAAPSATCLTALHVRCWQAVVAGRGAQASLARELKVDPSRISQIKSSATAKVRETLYIAGVLAHLGTLERRGPDSRLPGCLRHDGRAGSGADHRTARPAGDRRARGERKPRERTASRRPGRGRSLPAAQGQERVSARRSRPTSNSAANSRPSSPSYCTRPKSPSRVRSIIPIRIARSTVTRTIRSTIASSGISSGHERQEFASRIFRSERSE